MPSSSRSRGSWGGFIQKVQKREEEEGERRRGEEERRGGEKEGGERNGFGSAFMKMCVFELSKMVGLRRIILSTTQRGLGSVQIVTTHQGGASQTIDIPHPSFHETQCTYNHTNTRLYKFAHHWVIR